MVRRFTSAAAALLIEATAAHAAPAGLGWGTVPMAQRSADAHFIVMMTPHHEGAIAMAELALQRSQRTEIRAMAERIRTSQSQENAQMRRWYQLGYGTAKR